MTSTSFASEDPFAPKDVYLDANGTTKLHPTIVSSISHTLSTCFGNPATHSPSGIASSKTMEKAERSVLVNMLGVPSSSENTGEIIWTACGTESDNLAITIAIEGWNYRNNNNDNQSSLRKTPHVISCTTEHPAILKFLHCLKKEGRLSLTLVGPSPSSGTVSSSSIIDAITAETALITLMVANNETGLINDVSSISKAVKGLYPDIVFHTDAAQACGKMDCSIRSDSPIGSNTDMITLVGHKFSCPKGIACLYLTPQYIAMVDGVPGMKECLTNGGSGVSMLGGGQCNGWRSGTPNVPYIVGFGAAAALLAGVKDSEFFDSSDEINKTMELSNLMKHCNKVKQAMIDAITEELGGRDSIDRIR